MRILWDFSKISLMKYALNTLPDDIHSLQEIIIFLHNNVEKIEEEKKSLQQNHDHILQEKIKTDAELATVRLKLDHVLEQFKLSKQRQFGRSSEKDLIQYDIFDEAGVTLPTEAQEDVADETEVITYERKKNAGKSKRKALPDYLPREVKTYDSPEDEKTCACCGSEKVCFGKEISEQLKVIPPQIVVISHQRLKYCCKPCEGEISIAPKPALFLPKSMADASLVAYTIILKYVDHLPLYRQEHIWARNKIELPRNTTCAWVMKSATLCEPLVNVMRLELIKSGYVQADETPTQVLNEPKRKNTQKSYMWVYRKAIGTPLILYEYQETREAKHPKRFLAGFTGRLQTDAYSGYDWSDEMPGVVHLACMTHGRRPFAELQKLAKKSKGLAYQALEIIGVLYHIEAQIKDKTVEEKYQIRQEQAKPQLEKLQAWLLKHVSQAPPKGKLGQAMRYLINHWQKLIRYIDDGRLHIDNNAIENDIRPFALGKKNWLFYGNPRGAKAGAVFYSLLITAKANQLNEHAYLTFVFNRIRACKTEDDYRKLLPGYLTAEEAKQLALK